VAEPTAAAGDDGDLAGEIRRHCFGFHAARILGTSFN
jgi:hypothetical protein